MTQERPWNTSGERDSEPVLKLLLRVCVSRCSKTRTGNNGHEGRDIPRDRRRGTRPPRDPTGGARSERASPDEGR